MKTLLTQTEWDELLSTHPQLKKIREELPDARADLFPNITYTKEVLSRDYLGEHTYKLKNEPIAVYAYLFLRLTAREVQGYTEQNHPLFLHRTKPDHKLVSVVLHTYEHARSNNTGITDSLNQATTDTFIVPPILIQECQILNQACISHMLLATNNNPILNESAGFSLPFIKKAARIERLCLRHHTKASHEPIKDLLANALWLDTSTNQITE